MTGIPYPVIKKIRQDPERQSRLRSRLLWLLQIIAALIQIGRAHV